MLSDDSAQPFEVHAVCLAIEKERIFDYLAAVAFDNSTEGSVDGWLNDNSVALAGEVIDCQRYAFDNSGNESEFAALDAEVVAAFVPVDDGLPVAVGGFEIAQDGV